MICCVSNQDSASARTAGGSSRAASAESPKRALAAMASMSSLWAARNCFWTSGLSG